MARLILTANLLALVIALYGCTESNSGRGQLVAERMKRATDRLIGLKENVIIGKLIPARHKIIDEEEEMPAPEKGEEEEGEESVLDHIAGEAKLTL